jgi:ribonuclease P protein component
MSERFSKTRRVRQREEFQRVFDSGVRTHGRFLTLITAANGGKPCRLGIVASRKLGGAVDRNRAKRLIREMFRRSSPLRARHGVDLVVIPRRELLDASTADLQTDFQNTCRRAAGKAGAHERG